MKKGKWILAAFIACVVMGCTPGKNASGTSVRHGARRIPKAGHIIADRVRALEISRKGDLVGGVIDGDIRLYTASGREKSRFGAPEGSRFERFFAAPDFSWFVALSLSSSGPAVHFLDASLAERNRLKFSEDTLVTLGEVAPSGDRVYMWTMESPGLASDYRRLRELQESKDPKARQEMEKMRARLKRKFITKRQAFDRQGLEIWSLGVGELTVDLLSGSGEAPVTPGPLTSSPDGKYFISQGTAGTQTDPVNMVYDAHTGFPVFQIPMRENEQVIPRWANSDVGLFAFSILRGEDPMFPTFKVSRWDVSGKKLWERDVPNLLEYANLGMTGNRIVLITSPAGKESEKSVLIWDETGKEGGAKTLDLLAELGKEYVIRETVSVDLSDDGKHLMFCGIYIVPSILGKEAPPRGSVRDQGFFQCRVYDTDTGRIIFKTQSLNLQDGSQYRGVFGRGGNALAEIRYPPPPPQQDGQQPTFEVPQKIGITIYTY
ncbi:MAG: hypothetical protein V2G42_08015 [bacterium JZ-2024 1]